MASVGGMSTYVTSLNPSACNRSSATYWGAQQILLVFNSRSRLVSGGGSALARRAVATRRPLRREMLDE